MTTRSSTPPPQSELGQQLTAAIPGLEVRDTPDFLDAHSRDHTEDLQFLPDVVALPKNTAEVSSLLAWANARRVPVTAAGAWTGLSGGALPVKGGISLSTKRLNRIVKIDELHHQLVVQPGVIVQEMQEAVQAKGLFYAVDPASRGTCTIGGNLAENSGGPRAVKYGVTKDWVLNLEVVLADGTIMKTGADTLKNSTGYNVTQLMIGSEGTLGIITEATLKLLPWPKYNALLLVPFSDPKDACHAVAGIFQDGNQPSALEFMERAAIELAMDFTQDRQLPLSDDTAAHLLIEVDAFREDDLMPQLERLADTLGRYNAGEPLMAMDTAGKAQLWNLRRKVGEAVKAHSTYKEEDTVVPRGHLPELLEAVKRIGGEYGFESVCYGHAGDGNLHVNILKGSLSDEIWHGTLPQAIRAIFKEVVDLGGTISGEHGIGWVQKAYMDVRFSPAEMDLQRRIKAAFDPVHTLNPDKILPQGASSSGETP
jgi:glycolate oxidase